MVLVGVAGQAVDGDFVGIGIGRLDGNVERTPGRQQFDACFEGSRSAGIGLLLNKIGDYGGLAPSPP